MALINCPECGGQVSDRADVCPLCGFSLKYEAISLVEKKPVNKIVITIVGIIAVCIVVLMLILAKIGGNTIYDKQGHMRGFAWGTSKQEVRDILEKENGEKPNAYNGYLSEYVADFEGLKDFKATVMYSFDYGGLSEAVVLLNSTSKYDVETLFSTFQDKLEKTYGKPEDSMLSGLLSTWYAGDSKIALIWYNPYCVMIKFSAR